MFKKFLSLVVSIAIVLAGISYLSIPSYAEKNIEPSQYEAGVVLVQTKETPVIISDDTSLCSTDSSESVIEKVLSSNSDFSIEKMINLNGLSSSSFDSDSSNLYLVSVGSNDVLKSCKSINNIEGVQAAEPNYIFSADSIPTEISVPSVMYKNYQSSYFDDLDVTSAWNKYDAKGSGTVVAVIDSGVSLTSTDLAEDQLWSKSDGSHGYNFVSNSTDITDTNGHGTNVASIIAMKQNNDSLVGLAPEAKIMGIKVGNADTFYENDLISGMNYAVTNGADIINMSLGETAYSQIFKNICTNAAEKCIIVASAGNNSASSSTEKMYPAAFSSVIGVMAYSSVTSSYQYSSTLVYDVNKTSLCFFSNYDDSGSNEYYQVAAPGFSIIGRSCSSTGCTLMTGTSQSAPIVVALIADYISLYPNATLAQIKDAVVNSCTDTVTFNSQITSDTGTAKKVNLLKLLKYSDPGIPAEIEPQDSIEMYATNDNLYFLSGFPYNTTYDDIVEYSGVQANDGSYEIVPAAYGYGTGAEIICYEKSGDINNIYYIMMLGDMDGDAEVNGYDAIYILAAIDQNNGYNNSISPIQIIAADVNSDLNVTQADYLKIADKGVFITE